MCNNRDIKKKKKKRFFFNGRLCLCYNKQLVNGERKKEIIVQTRP